MTHRRLQALICVVVALTIFCSLAFSAEIPTLAQKDGRYALMVDGAPFLMLGGQVNNSSAWPAMLPQVWTAIDYIHANTVEVPVYWEQIEAKQGQFDFSVVDTLIKQAREHNVRLVLLWFGSSKNAGMHYAPEWVKTDQRTYPRMMNAKREPMDIISPLGQASLEADKKAFVALMRHLKQVDSDQHTVIMVQVENETGSYGTPRDFSPIAQKAFESPIPKGFAAAMRKSAGSWQQAFGPDADEAFAAYYMARFVDEVAAAGKAEYPLPMYVNAALRDPEDANARPGATYPSGGPSHNVIDIWKAVAKHIDLLAPDIYLSGDSKYVKVLDLYSRPDNALFIPETSNKPENAKFFFSALDKGAIGFSPFGIDRTGYLNAPLGADDVSDKGLEPFAANYRLLGPMQREIARLNFEGKLRAVAEQKGKPSQTFEFGRWQVKVSYGLPQFGFGNNPPGNPNSDGRALIAQLGADEFLVTGINARVDFEVPPSVTGQHMDYLRVEEGQYKDGQWQFKRIWNGDQTDWGLNFKQIPHVLRIKLMTY